jgi:hypothetical protein
LSSTEFVNLASSLKNLFAQSGILDKVLNSNENKKLPTTTTTITTTKSNLGVESMETNDEDSAKMNKNDSNKNQYNGSMFIENQILEPNDSTNNLSLSNFITTNCALNASKLLFDSGHNLSSIFESSLNAKLKDDNNDKKLFSNDKEQNNLTFKSNPFNPTLQHSFSIDPSQLSSITMHDTNQQQQQQHQQNQYQGLQITGIGLTIKEQIQNDQSSVNNNQLSMINYHQTLNRSNSDCSYLNHQNNNNQNSILLSHNAMKGFNNDSEEEEFINWDNLL